MFGFDAPATRLTTACPASSSLERFPKQLQHSPESVTGMIPMGDGPCGWWMDPPGAVHVASRRPHDPPAWIPDCYGPCVSRPAMSSQCSLHGRRPTTVLGRSCHYDWSAEAAAV